MARWALALVALACWAQSLDELMQEAMRLRQAGKLDESIQQCKKLLELAGRQNNVTAEIWARRGLAGVYHQQARYPAEREELEAVLALLKTSGDRRGMGQVSNNLGTVAHMMGEWERARGHYLEALGHFEAAGEEREALNTVVNLVFVPLDSAEKERLLEEGRRRARRLGDELSEGRLLHLAADDDYVEGNFARSLERLQRAIELFEKIGEKRWLAGALTSLGRLHRAHGLPERALEYHRRALRIREQLGDRERIMQSLNAIAVTYGSMGEHRRALEYQERALVMARQTGSPVLFGFQLQQLGRGYLRVREFRRAAEILEEALAVGGEATPILQSALSGAYLGLGRLEAALVEAEKAVEQCRLPSAIESDDLPRSLWQRAIVKKKLGRPAEALADLRQAMDYLESLRARLAPADYMKVGFTDQWPRLYDLAIEIFHGARMHERAFEAAEQGRARAFVDLLATREFLKGANPDLKSLASVGPFTARQMTEQVERIGSTLLAYWVGEEATYLWVFGPEAAVRGFRIPASRERLRRLAADASDKNKLDRKESFRELYRLLVEPARSLLPKREGSLLTIVPQGPLFQVSFAALADGRGRYLAEDYALHYVPAGAVLAFTGRQKRPEQARASAYLVIADPASAPPLPDGQPMPRLPGARREAEAVMGLAAGSASTLLAGLEAGPDHVRRMAAGKRVLHFATHSIIRDDRPMESFLALEGGKLTAQEVYQLPLDADLVFLSACRTGLGRISGDGIVGLTRAFFYAGAPSVVATLGEIADVPTVRLVEEFYRRFRESGNKSAALRAAQLQLLSELRQGKVKAGSITLSEHPVFWANFVLQGEP
ncbi:MAG: CHAT domain-containing protein [Acidobacteria bacterium]|nr:CHAT domain-containing protein [Acidobacteriota bacterium]